MAAPCTLDEYLDRGPENLRLVVDDWVSRLTPRQYPASVVVHYRGDADVGMQRIVELPIAERPASVQALIEAVREALTKHVQGRLIVSGQVRTTCASKGNKASPEASFTRTICPPSATSEMSELAWMRRELAEVRAQNQALLQLVVTGAGQDKETTRALVDQLQKLATTRAVVSAGSDVSPVAMMIGVIVLPVLLPKLNRLMGLRHDAPITESVQRLQALGQGAVERLVGQLEVVEPDPPVRPRIRELVDRELPAEEPAALLEASPTPATSPAWPEPEALVQRLVDDEPFRDAVFTALIASEPARAVLKGKIPALLAAL